MYIKYKMNPEEKKVNAYYAQQRPLKTKDEDIIYHVNPAGVIEANPELAGKVKQAYIFCKTCNVWRNLTTENSLQLSFGEFCFKKENYIGDYCLTPECNQKLYQEEINKIKKT